MWAAGGWQQLQARKPQTLAVLFQSSGFFYEEIFLNELFLVDFQRPEMGVLITESSFAGFLWEKICQLLAITGTPHSFRFSSLYSVKHASCNHVSLVFFVL